MIGIRAVAETTMQPLAADPTTDRLARITDRLARLEEAVANIKENMATGADIEGVKTLIAEKEAAQTKWLLGIMAAAAVTVVVAMIRTFM